MLSGRKLYRPIYDDRRRDWQRIVKYHLAGYDISQWWQGIRMTRPLPTDQVKLYLGGGIPTDFIPNPLSLQICTDRLAQLICEAAPNDVQMFDVEVLNSNTGKEVTGLKILNVCRRVPCLEFSRSVISFRRDQPTQIAGIPKPVVRMSEVPDDVHVFRVDEFFPIILVTDHVLDAVYHSGVKGIAFGECETF